MIGIRARNAPAGAGTPVANSCDQVGALPSISRVLKRASLSAMQTVKNNTIPHPTRPN
ncbi:MAG: hypothetical protein NTX76_03305 [Alphaproteobacteria bacterium]|nr:hypothetical protein [Alphaproteobacteria bacterium]